MLHWIEQFLRQESIIPDGDFITLSRWRFLHWHPVYDFQTENILIR